MVTNDLPVLKPPPLVCTVLPTYNERGNIGPLIDGILLHARTPQMVLVVDDNSPDGTWEVVKQLAQRYNRPDAHRVVLYRRIGPKGLTSAIQHGIDMAIYTFGASIVTWMDCDLSMPPEDVSRLVACVEDGADIAVGSRWIEGGADDAHGQMARTLSLIINGYAMLRLGVEVHDYTSGFIAARSEVLRALAAARGLWRILYRPPGARRCAQGCVVREVPYRCVPRNAGESKTGANLWDYLVKGRKYVSAIERVAAEPGA